jgi:hypothetical protein
MDCNQVCIKEDVVTGLLCVLSFFLGMVFRVFLTWLDRPSVTRWGESTRYWSDADWSWFRKHGRHYEKLDEN